MVETFHVVVEVLLSFIDSSALIAGELQAGVRLLVSREVSFLLKSASTCGTYVFL